MAYVFAFSQLVGLLINDPTWSGVGRAALLFGLLWLPWQQLTWAANAVSGNGRRIRIIFLVATVLSIPMAGATSTALAGGGLVFALALSGIMLLGFLIQGMATSSETSMRDAVFWWIAPNVLSIAVLIAGGMVTGTTRLILWTVTLALVLGAMILAGRGEWLIRIGHMAERHALIVIVALGEVIVAIGIPVATALQDSDSLPIATVGALIASGLSPAFSGGAISTDRDQDWNTAGPNSKPIGNGAGTFAISTRGRMLRSWRDHVVSGGLRRDLSSST